MRPRTAGAGTGAPGGLQGPSPEHEGLQRRLYKERSTQPATKDATHQ